MRVLAHIHTFNDADIIDETIAAVRRQTRPVDGLIVVDNASTDGTLECPSLRDVEIIRHRDNLGTSGAVHSGFRYALDHGYDWIWVLDADSIVAPDALEKLLELYQSWPRGRQEETAFLATQGYNIRDGFAVNGQMFIRRGFEMVNPPPGEQYYPCHVTIWSGCLYRLAAVRQIGLPNPDYVLDWGEGEYGYRTMKAGYKGFIHRGANLQHNVRGSPSFVAYRHKVGPITIKLYRFPPIRCYYACRNSLYFPLYDIAEWRLRLVLSNVLTHGKITVNFLMRPWSHGAQIAACFRGIWHGLTGNIAARY